MALMKSLKIVGISILTIVLLFLAFFSWAWLSAYTPEGTEKIEVNCSPEAKSMPAGHRLKVLNWNIQYMASKDYVFFYDVPDGSGPDARPSDEAVTRTIKDVARVIKEENPDVIVLQEIHDKAVRTSHRDQLAELKQELGKDYGCDASAFYWKAKFVLHPKIMGSVGMKLSTLSKYKINSATRFQLPLMDNDPITRHFYFYRAILETRMAVAEKDEISIMNTHLDAFSQGTDTMQRQIARVDELLSERQKQGIPFLITGDFNLLPPGKGRGRLPEHIQPRFNEKPEIKVLYDKYAAIPSLAQANGPEAAKWYTHLPNDPAITKPDRTIDYMFYDKKLKLLAHRVRQGDTWKISDHLPLIATFELSR